jgi:hypothetical protein
VFKPWQFCSNRGRFCNGVWVRAEERARIDTNGPILWRIVCRVCRWSFFWRIIEKFIFIEKRGEPLNWGSQGITIYIFSREFSLISLVSLFYLLFDETKNTTHKITNDNNNDNKVKIFSRVKISFCRKDTHTTKRI